MQGGIRLLNLGSGCHIKKNFLNLFFFCSQVCKIRLYSPFWGTRVPLCSSFWGTPQTPSSLRF